MAMPGMGCFIAWYDVKPGREADHHHWHSHEHMVERVAIPGFLRGLRYHSLSGTPRICVIYQTDTVETFVSPAYLERLNNPTPWTSSSLPMFVGMNRTLCKVASTFGHGIGGNLLTIQLAAKPDDADRLMVWLSRDTLPDIAGRPGISGAHLLIADRPVSETASQEKTLRGNPDAIADWVLLIEGYDRAALDGTLAELVGSDGLGSQGATVSHSAGVYALDFTLGEDEAKRIWRKPPA